MLSVAHICFFIVTTLLAIIAAIIVSKKFGWNQRVLYVVCALAVISEVTKTFLRMEETENGFYLRQQNLPFHLCSIQIIFIFMITFSKNEKLKYVLMSFMYPTMLGGGLMALVIPTDAVEFGFITPISFQFHLYHGLLVFFALYMMMTKPINFNMKSYYISLVFTVAIFFFAINLNSMLGAATSGVNFFYTARPPLDDLPILNLNHGWIVYILNLAWLALVMISLCYIPVFIKAIKARLTKRAERLKITHDDNDKKL